MIKIGGGCRQVLNAHTYYYGYFNVCSMVCGVVIKSVNCRTIAFFYPSFFFVCVILKLNISCKYCIY